MVPNVDQARPEFKALINQSPGGAITCPYCQGAVEYKSDGETLTVSARAPFRYSKVKMYLRAEDYGNQKSPPVSGMTPEQWIAEEKLMPNSLQGYWYAEDFSP